MSAAPTGAQYLTGLDVSHGTALLPIPYRRWTARDGGAVNVGLAGTAGAFVWTRAGAPPEPPVVGVAVLYDDEPAPDGFRKVARDLTGGGTGRRAYLAFATAPLGSAEAHRAVAAIRVVPDGDGAGEERLGLRRVGHAGRAW